MFKKLTVLLMIFIATFVTVGCESTTSETTDSTTDTTTLTTTDTTTSTSATTVTTSATSLLENIPADCNLALVENDWVPVWCDEFNGTGAVDSTKWRHVTGGGGFGNEELEYYTSRSQNATIANGKLIITALKESYGGMQYTSAKIWTQGVINFKYGKIELRAKLPTGRGTWPAFWMMPQTSKYGAWPRSGEIDIMEHVGYDPNVVLGTLHTERYYGTNGRGGNTDSLLQSGDLASIDVQNEFHTYSIVWEEGKIEWYFDDLLFGSVSYDPAESDSRLYEPSVDWPFDQPFYLIINLAVGGTWGGAQGVDDTCFPTTLEVDYVRIYQKDYLYGDTANPSRIVNPQILYQSGTTAYLLWTPAMDDLRVKQYWVYINGILAKKTTVWGVRLTTLTANFDNIVTILTEDYSGKMSEPFYVAVTTH